MTRYLYPVMVVVLSTFFLGAGFQTAFADIKEDAKDTKITTSVKTHLATEDRMKTLTQIEVKTVDGTVYLNGSAPSMQEKLRAEDITRKVEGVKMVVNDIKVHPATDK